jgi:prevent-host-death family protein
MEVMAPPINVHQAKTHFSRLLAQVEAGEEVLIAKAGRPVARLVPVRQDVRNRVPGFDKDKVWIAEDFDAPLPPPVEDEFYK